MSRNSFRSIAKFMNPIMQADSLSELWKEHRHLTANQNISLRNLIDRHAGQDLKFLSYNTWLLRAPGNDKPAIPYRAYLLGQELKRSGYDLAALTEVFKSDDAKLIKGQSGIKWDELMKIKPTASFPPSPKFSNGGLYTMSNLKITHTDFITFKNDGGLAANDSLSGKGVLLCEIETTKGNVDLYSTHLVYGDSLPLSFTELNEQERSKLRLEQVKELKRFVHETHKPENVAIITGDFNIDAEEADGRSETYERMMRMFSNIPLSDGKSTRFSDLWIKKGGKKGATDQSWKKCRMRTNGEPVYCDDFAERDFNQDDIPSEGRIDYIFIEEPRESHSFMIDSTMIRRRPFPLKRLELNEIIDLLEVAAENDFKKEVQKRMDGDVDNLFRFSESRRHALLTISRNLNLKQLFNNWLKRECKMGWDDKTGHLSDHIGLDVTFILSK